MRTQRVNLAPDVDVAPTSPTSPTSLTLTPSGAGADIVGGGVVPAGSLVVPLEDEAPRKKKYAKEAWPGKHPTGALLVG